MTHTILGLHHVTATVGAAQPDLDFCLNLSGMRLVKKTVNFDNHHVYHFYYGDERGTPGTIWTTFPYKGRGVPVGTKGFGQVGDDRLLRAGRVDGILARPPACGRRWHEEIGPRFGDEVVRFDDPSGLWFELVASDRDAARAVDRQRRRRGRRDSWTPQRHPAGPAGSADTGVDDRRARLHRGG